MDIQKLKDLSADELQIVLAEATETSENQTYYRPMDDAEAAIVKHELSQTSIDKSYLEEEIEEARTEFKLRMEPLKLAISDCIEQLRTNTRKVTGKVFTLADYDTKMVHTVDEKGYVISSRQMKPEERQLRLTPSTLSKAV